MKSKITKLIYRFDLDHLWMVCSLAFSAYYWLLWGLMQNTMSFAQTRNAGFMYSDILLALLTGMLSSFILRSIGYFDSLRIIPRKSDFLLMLFSLSIGGCVIALVHAMVFGNSPARLVRLALSLPLVASLYFDAYMEFTTWLSKTRKRRISLNLDVNEANELVRALKAAKLSQEVDIQPSSVNKSNVDLIIVSRAGVRDMQADSALLVSHLQGIPILDRRALLASLTRRVSVDDIDVWSYILSAKPQTRWIRFGRAAQDIFEPILAVAMLIVLSPIMALVALMIKYTSPGPVIYSQKRTGYMGRVFNMYKFRSMRTDSEVQGIQWAQKSDPRVTPVGRFIRKVRLDELPQLWNVARRDMGIVGPRPERPEIYEDLKSQIPLFSLRTLVRPGITGWAQVCSGYAASVEESKLKLEHDLYYIQNMSLRLDFVVVLMTIKVVLFGSEYISSPDALSFSHLNPELTGTGNGPRRRPRLRNRRAI